MKKIMGHEFSGAPVGPGILQRSDRYLSKPYLSKGSVQLQRSPIKLPRLSKTDSFNLGSLDTLRTVRAGGARTESGSGRKKNISRKRAEALQSLRALKAAVAKRELER
jgi:hypothetical protein